MMRRSMGITLISACLYLCCANIGNKTKLEKEQEEESWPFSNTLDAVSAAPESHEILLENDEVRVMRVIIPPGTKEPMHTHQWKSVMIVEQPTRIRYYNDKDKMLFESDAKGLNYDSRPPQWMEPEGPHAVENIETLVYSAIRIELKQ